MRKISKATAFQVTAVGGISLLVAAAAAPGAIAAGTVDGDVKVSNTETVQVLMDATGKIDSQRVYDQLVLTGTGKVDIANPVSTKGLRNLDGFAGYDVRDGKVRVKTDVDGTKKFRSVSDFTRKLPLDVSVSYFLDGKEVRPGDVVGKSGDLEVLYRVTNNTGVDEDVPFEDGKGDDKTSPESVVIPMVGSLTTTLPSNFTKVQSAEANAAGDGRGGTTLSFTMTLIPPIGKNYADFGYTAHVKEGIIPKANISALPVNPLESQSFKGGAASYKGGAQTGTDLTAGATEIDANVLKLRDGASDLVAGILKLQEGAGQLSAGLNNDAAPGAKRLADGANQLNAGAEKLAAGMGDLDDGAKKLNTGAGDLSDGLATAEDAAPELLDGIVALTEGAELIDAGLATLNGQVVPGANQINVGATALVAGIKGGINTNLDNANNAIAGAKSLVHNSPTMDAGEKINAEAALVGATQYVGGVRLALNNTTAPTGFMYGLGAIQQGSAQIRDGVNAQTSAAAAGTDGTLKNGMAQLIGGLGQLEEGGLDLLDGLGQLSAGANRLSAGTDELRAGTTKLNTGAGTLKGGTGELSAGAGLLSGGLGTAAAGSGKLADGLNQAAKAAPALPEGADRLSKEGTSRLVEAGDETASDYGLKYALIAAGAERAGAAQPYGSPEGATELTAYKFELAGAEGEDSANLKRGLAAIVLLAGTAGIAAIRRKRLI